MSDEQKDDDDTDLPGDGFDFDFDVEALDDAEGADASPIAPDDTMNISFDDLDDDEDSGKG